MSKALLSAFHVCTHLITFNSYSKTVRLLIEWSPLHRRGDWRWSSRKEARPSVMIFTYSSSSRLFSSLCSYSHCPCYFTIKVNILRMRLWNISLLYSILQSLGINIITPILYRPFQEKRNDTIVLASFALWIIHEAFFGLEWVFPACKPISELSPSLFINSN